MIEVSRVEVHGLANALYGMRLPKNSNWKSDTECLVYDLGLKKTITVGINDLALDTQKIIDVKIGDEDRRLSTTLVKAGKTHSKWMREVQISMLVNAPLYWWKEFDQYKVGTTTNSESTMHTITQKEFTKDMFSFEKTLGLEEVQGELDNVVELLNSLRVSYLGTNSPLTKKRIWDTIIQILPSSWNQARMVTFSLQTASGMYFDRKNHKLSEWVEFCEELSKLPTVGEFITL